MFDLQNEGERKNFECTPQSRGSEKGGPKGKSVYLQLVVSVFHFHLTGVFDIDNSHLQLTICPRHRDSFCVRWRSNKTNCTAPTSWCSHPTKAVRGERGITLSQSRQLLNSTGVLLPVASRKL